MYRFNSIGFKLGHSAIKSAKLVESSLTAVCLFLASTESCCFPLQAAAAEVEESVAPFSIKRAQ